MSDTSVTRKGCHKNGASRMTNYCHLTDEWTQFCDRPAAQRWISMQLNTLDGGTAALRTTVLSNWRLTKEPAKAV